MTLEEIQERLESAVPGAILQWIENGSPSGQHSLLLEPSRALDAVRFLRDDPEIRLDYLSNLTGVHVPEHVVGERDPDNEDEENRRTVPGSLVVVYHLYSIAHRYGPVVLRMQTTDNPGEGTLPSMVAVHRGAEFQEREVFDLYGVRFDGHPDLRRILMWDEFKDHPMRKDYTPPDDYEYEPTPHDETLVRARKHYGEEGK